MIEMLADWKAASLRRGGTPEDFQKSIKSSQDRFGFSDNLSEILEGTAKELGW